MEIEAFAEETIISGELFYADTEKLVKHFKQLLGSGKDDFHVDLSKVEAVDTAALQVIISFLKSAARIQKKVMFTNLSESFKSALEITGLDAFFSNDL
jgi:anti-anti-sigma factor